MLGPSAASNAGSDAIANNRPGDISTRTVSGIYVMLGDIYTIRRKDMQRIATKGAMTDERKDQPSKPILSGWGNKLLGNGSLVQQAQSEDLASSQSLYVPAHFVAMRHKNNGTHCLSAIVGSYPSGMACLSKITSIVWRPDQLIGFSASQDGPPESLLSAAI